MVEQVLGLGMPLCVVPRGFGEARELTGVSMLYRDVSRAVMRRLDTRVLKRYMGYEDPDTCLPVTL